MPKQCAVLNGSKENPPKINHSSSIKVKPISSQLISFDIVYYSISFINL